ncbi:MAG: hypothetical protein J6U74_03720 [Clostridia bacterium]|nr:hypothetical protein [Clostridia bacterium]
MANIVELKLTQEELLSLADKKLLSGDTEGAIKYLKKTLALDDSCVEALIKLADIYANLGAQQISNTVFYRALVSKPTPEQEDRIFYRLAHNFLDLGMLEVVAYYMRYFGDDFDPSVLENKEEKINPFRLVSGSQDEYYEGLIEKAYARIQDRDFDGAIALASKIDRNSRAGDAANHITLVSYMMKNDVDRVIYEARRMLEKEDSLSVRSTLATALMIEEKNQEAYEVVEEILKKDYNRLEEILIILPLLVSLNMHSHVIIYTKKALKHMPLQPNGLIWLSQALYNVGQKSEAKRVMRTVLEIYGDYAPADYYLDLYNTNPDEVEYVQMMPTLKVPHTERFRRYKLLEEYSKLSKDDFDNALDNNSDLQKIIRWAFVDGNEKVLQLLLQRMSFAESKWLEGFYREVLITPGLSFDTMSAVLAYILDGDYELDFSVVTQDRFKDVSLRLPEAFYQLPKIMREAVGYSVCDIIFTDEDPNTYINRLCNAVDSIVGVGKEGKLVYFIKKPEKLVRLRSAQTLAGVLLSYVYYDEENPKMDSINRYNLNERTFDKYYKILFGDDRDEE